MRHLLSSLPKIFILLFALVLVTPQGDAFAKNKNVRKVPAMSITVHKALQRAQEAMAEKDYAGSKSILAEMLARPKTNDYERAVAWQLRAIIAFEENDTPDTIAAYEKILTFKNSIPEMLEINIIYGLSQLYYSEEDYDKALEYAENWHTRVTPNKITVGHLQYMANLHYVRAEYRAAVDYIDQAIENAAAAGPIVAPKESWHFLKISALWELGEKEQTEAVVRERLASQPQLAHCRLLAAIYVDKGQSDAEALALARDASPACKDVQKVGTMGLTPNKDDALQAEDTPESPAKENADYLPINRVQPKLSKKALKEKRDGHVILEMTILADGTVDKDSIQILETKPKGLYEQIAIDAASQFRYRPKLVDGIPQTVKGVKYRFSFEFEN